MVGAAVAPVAKPSSVTASLIERLARRCVPARISSATPCNDMRFACRRCAKQLPGLRRPDRATQLHAKRRAWTAPREERRPARCATGAATTGAALAALTGAAGVALNTVREGAAVAPPSAVVTSRVRTCAAGVLGCSASRRLRMTLPHGSNFTSTTRSFMGMIALSVILMCSGQTSVQHLVMLHKPRPCSSCSMSLAVDGVEGVHVELCIADEEPGPGERGLVLFVVAHNVAGVLAQEALDALAELLRPLDVDLLHPVVAGLEVRRAA